MSTMRMLLPPLVCVCDLRGSRGIEMTTLVDCDAIGMANMLYCPTRRPAPNQMSCATIIMHRLTIVAGPRIFKDKSRDSNHIPAGEVPDSVRYCTVWYWHVPCILRTCDTDLWHNQPSFADFRPDCPHHHRLSSVVQRRSSQSC